MPRKKEIEAAWDVHDEIPEKFGCEQEGDWKGEHSRFNTVCQRLVLKYAIEHPIPRQLTKVEKPVKIKCDVCKKLKAESRMVEVEKIETVNGEKKIVTKNYCEKCWRRTEKRIKQKGAQTQGPN